MFLNPIKQELLDNQYHILMAVQSADDSSSMVALRLARFAEAHAINEGNRQIEALTPKPFRLPADITSEDARRMRLEMRSKLFSYFIWHFPAGTDMALVAQMVEEALLAVETIRANHQLKEE